MTSRRLRVCVLAACPVPFPRGTPIRVTRLTEAVARLGHEVHLVTYATSSGPIDPLVHVHRIRGVPRLGAERPGPSLGKFAILDPLLALRFRRLLREREFDVVHAHHYEGLLIASMAGTGTAPLIYDAHTVLETELPSYGLLRPRALARKVGRLLDRTLPSRARLVVAVSEPLRDHLVSTGAVRGDRIAVVGNGVEMTHFSNEPCPGNPPSDGGTIVYAGNFAPYQGIPLLLEAFRAVVDRRPAARLHLVTSSPFDEFEGMARELGIRDRIVLRPAPFESLGRELGQAHVAVNPRPKCEGVPQKNLNYMAAGVPMVAFMESLHPGRDGATGVGVESVSGRALADAILRILAHPEEGRRIAAAARASLDPEYTWRGQAERLVRLYEELSTSSSS
jgi:glycosyltransferase involved in cell wall biosynthesis